MNSANDGHPEPRGAERRSLQRRMWSCAVISLALAVAVFTAFGFKLWTALIAVVFLACPVTMLWVAVTGNRPIPFPIGPIPKTRGYTLNWLAPYYDLVCRTFGIGPSFRTRTLALANLRQGDHVLDVGCGTGVLSRMAADTVGSTGVVWGVDPAADMIRIARQNAASVDNAARFKPAAAEDLPFTDRSFDVVLMSFVLHHLPGDLKQVALREILRVLKPEGRFVAVDVDRPGIRAWWLVVWPLRLIAGPAENLSGRIEAAIRGAGFTDVRHAGRWGGLVSFWTARRPVEI